MKNPITQRMTETRKLKSFLFTTTVIGMLVGSSSLASDTLDGTWQLAVEQNPESIMSSETVTLKFDGNSIVGSAQCVFKDGEVLTSGSATTHFTRVAPDEIRIEDTATAKKSKMSSSDVPDTCQMVISGETLKTQITGDQFQFLNPDGSPYYDGMIYHRAASTAN